LKFNNKAEREVNASRADKSKFKHLGQWLIGPIFVILWASASTGTKIGLEVAQPFVLFEVRFAIAALAMLLLSHFILRKPLPKGSQMWKQLFIYGFLNVGLYLGLFVIALQEVSAGLGSLFVAINPVLITLFLSFFGKQPWRRVVVLSLFLGLSGMMLAAYPLFESQHASLRGLLILLASNVSYSLSAVYFQQRDWAGLHILTINGWQTLFGGACLLPFMAYYYEHSANTFGTSFWISIIWLALLTSIGAVMLWLMLLKDNPTKAAFWLFLCPIVGFVFAALVINEPLSWHTFAGSILVLFGLYLVQKKT